MTQYIDKAAVVAEMERLYNLEYTNDSDLSCGKKIILRHILSFLDTPEVKNIDLEKEIKEEYLKRRYYGGRNNMLVILNELQFNKIAKHFFELGLKIK